VLSRTQGFTTHNVFDQVRSKPYSSTIRCSPLIQEYSDDFFLAVTAIYIVDVSVRFYGLGWRSFRANGWNLFDIAAAGGSFVTTLIVRFGPSGFATQQLQKLFLVSVAFKVVQSSDSLNKLFKTSM
jgi:hypothetical protein